MGYQVNSRMIRRRNWLVWVLLLMVVAIVVFLVANAAFALFVERRAETSLEARLGSPVSVDLSGFPVSPRLLTGSLPKADVTVQEIKLPGKRTSLGRLDITLTGVRYEGDRKGPLDPPIEARGVRFESRLGEDEVSSLSAALPAVKGAELMEGTGVRLLLVGGATVDAGLTVKKGGLVLEPDTPLLEPQIPLTPGGLSGGISVEKVHVSRSAVEIRGGANGLGV